MDYNFPIQYKTDSEGKMIFRSLKCAVTFINIKVCAKTGDIYEVKCSVFEKDKRAPCNELCAATLCGYLL